MSSDNSSNKADLSDGALSSLNIGNDNESSYEEKANNVCAACGKEGDGDTMNTCNKCDLVRYCNAECQKKHRSKHKKKCERRMAELYDEKLFKEPPPPEECPICMLPQPIHMSESTFFSCCGKSICCGCIYTMDEREGAKLCPFCRMPYKASGVEIIKKTKKQMEKGNARAYHGLAAFYAKGILGLPQDMVVPWSNTRATAKATATGNSTATSFGTR